MPSQDPTFLLIGSEKSSANWDWEREVVFRADGAFAEPEIYETLEETTSEICDSASGERQSAARHRKTADAPGGSAQS
jgi:hypothetical protein